MERAAWVYFFGKALDPLTVNGWEDVAHIGCSGLLRQAISLK